jgi:hypothetical protein
MIVLRLMRNYIKSRRGLYDSAARLRVHLDQYRRFEPPEIADIPEAKAVLLARGSMPVPATIARTFGVSVSLVNRISAPSRVS